MKKLKNLLRINLSKYSFKFLIHVNHLGHTGTPTNDQNSCIKLCGFGADITRLFLHWERAINISCRERLFNFENSFGGF